MNSEGSGKTADLLLLTICNKYQILIRWPTNVMKGHSDQKHISQGKNYFITAVIRLYTVNSFHSDGLSHTSGYIKHRMGHFVF